MESAADTFFGANDVSEYLSWSDALAPRMSSAHMAAGRTTSQTDVQQRDVFNSPSLRRISVHVCLLDDTIAQIRGRSERRLGLLQGAAPWTHSSVRLAWGCISRRDLGSSLPFRILSSQIAVSS